MLENSKDILKGDMCFTTIFWLVLCACSMSVMLWFSANKAVVIADGVMEETEEVQLPVREWDITLERTAGVYKSFFVLLPQDVKAGNIIMENHYMDGELWLYIKSTFRDFYEECSITGDTAAIMWGKCGEQEKGILLKLKMNQMYEYKSTMEGNMLVIAYDKPGAVYDKIIVLDPVGGGEETGMISEHPGILYEKDVALSVAKQVQKKLALEGVKVYLTRSDDSIVSEEKRLGLVQTTDADLYLRIGVSPDGETADRYGISCYYNEAFYLPDFGNIQLADLVVREVTIASGNKAEGLIPAGQDSILQKISIPATQLSVGYFGNEQERELLSRESYREKIADGIVMAITRACDSLAQIEQINLEERTE